MTEMTIDAPPSTNTRAVRLTEIARIFLKIGAMSYGVGIMGIMQSEVQEKRQWIGKEDFVQGIADSRYPRWGLLHSFCYFIYDHRNLSPFPIRRSSDHAHRLLWHRSCRR